MELQVQPAKCNCSSRSTFMAMPDVDLITLALDNLVVFPLLNEISLRKGHFHFTLRKM